MHGTINLLTFAEKRKYAKIHQKAPKERGYQFSNITYNLFDQKFQALLVLVVDKEDIIHFYMYLFVNGDRNQYYWQQTESALGPIQGNNQQPSCQVRRGITIEAMSLLFIFFGIFLFCRNFHNKAVLYILIFF